LPTDIVPKSSYKNPRQKWDERYSAFLSSDRIEPLPFVLDCLSELPGAGWALDIAGGAGRHSLALARRGLRVDVIDISWEGLHLARRRALDAGLSERIQFLVADVERPWLPQRRYEVILASFFLYRPLFPLIKDRLACGGWLIYETLLVNPANQSEIHHPGQADFWLKPGELREAFAEFQIARYDEGQHNGRVTAQLLARKPLNFKLEMGIDNSQD
jgi:hypothetical protein